MRPEEGVSSKFQAGASPAALSFSATANWAKTESRSQTFFFPQQFAAGQKVKNRQVERQEKAKVKVFGRRLIAFAPVLFDIVYQNIAQNGYQDKKYRFAAVEVEQNQKSRETENVKQAVQRKQRRFRKRVGRIETDNAGTENKRRQKRVFSSGRIFSKLMFSLSTLFLPYAVS